VLFATYQNTAQEKMKAMTDVITRIVVILSLENCLLVISLIRMVNPSIVPVAMAGITIPQHQQVGE
jgi:hypothetical protein